MWSLGSNGHSQLSLNHKDDVNSPAPCCLPPELTDALTIAALSCGGNHTWLVTTSGALYGCGSNEYHQLGLPEPIDVPVFRRLHTDKTWKYVGSGFSFSVLVSVEDEVWVTGTCDKGSLGQGPTSTATQGLRRVNMPPGCITGLAVSLSHVIVVVDESQVYGWGAGRKGALGPNVTQSTYLPERIWTARQDEKVKQVVVGKDWTAMMVHGDDSETALMTFPDDLTSRKFPIPKSHNLTGLASMSANWSTLHLRFNDGRVESHGRHDRGQRVPKESMPPMTCVASGSEHSLGISRDSQVYAWGWNEHGNCGPDMRDVTWINRVTHDGNVKVRDVAAGYGTTFFW